MVFRFSKHPPGSSRWTDMLLNTLYIIFSTLILTPIEGFQISRPRCAGCRSSPLTPRTTQLFLTDVASLRVSEIKAELQERGIDFSDCFDKESLVQRLRSARENSSPEPPSAVRTDAVAPSLGERPSSTGAASEQASVSDEDLLKELSRRTVKELRQELANRNLRWAGLLEKQDLVKAVLEAMQAEKGFSATGLLVPGQVTDLTQDQLEREIGAVDLPTPLLVDVYATWCGPCQLMAKQLAEAARELGGAVRCAKLDSDKHQQLAGQLRVQGLPTLILFENGKEVKRMEGALMKDQLLEWIVEE